MRGLPHRGRAYLSRLIDQRLRFDEHDGVTVGRDVEGLKHVRFEGLNAVGRGTVFQGGVTVGLASTIGPNSLVHGPVDIGRYCQFGASVGLYGRDHPTTLATTYVNRQLLGGALSELAREAPIRIGHGVWLGHGAVILRGVTVGNGAVIGAGAVVTADCPAYAVVVGNPARVVRTRVADDVAAAIEASRWWELTPTELEPYRDALTTDLAAEPAGGIALLEALAARR
ncbi:MAG: CatB-related O-acetyltransferase [Acidimicrobiales bacterium]